MRDLLGYLGLAKRAGKLIIGDVAVSQATDFSRLICVAEDLSPGSLKRARRAALIAGIPLVTLPCTKNGIGNALGRKPCGILALTDDGFAKALIEAVQGKQAAKTD